MCPLDQRHFRAKTWHKIRKDHTFDSEFYDDSPEEYGKIRETLHETSKEDAKEYMVSVYKMIIRWCNEEPTLTDGESEADSKSDDSKNKVASENSVTVIPLYLLVKLI